MVFLDTFTDRFVFSLAVSASKLEGHLSAENRAFRILENTVKI